MAKFFIVLKKFIFEETRSSILVLMRISFPRFKIPNTFALKNGRSQTLKTKNTKAKTVDNL
jgi:hypothetical protein